MTNYRNVVTTGRKIMKSKYRMWKVKSVIVNLKPTIFKKCLDYIPGKYFSLELQKSGHSENCSNLEKDINVNFKVRFTEATM